MFVCLFLEATNSGNTITGETKKLFPKEVLETNNGSKPETEAMDVTQGEILI